MTQFTFPALGGTGSRFQTRENLEAEVRRVVGVEAAERIAGDAALQSQVEALTGGVLIVGEWDADSGAFPTTRPDASPIQPGDGWVVTGAGTVDGVAFDLTDRLISLGAGGATYAGNWVRAGYSDLFAAPLAQNVGGTGAASLGAGLVTPAGPDGSEAPLADHLGLSATYLRRAAPVTPFDYGAVGGAQTGVTTEGDVGHLDDTQAVLDALTAAQTEGRALHLPGVFRIHNAELTIRETLTLTGIGGATEYRRINASGTLPLMTLRSGLVFTGAGSQRVRTRRLHRATAGDPQDAPLSVGIDIEAPFTRLENFGVWLWFNQADASPTNFGSTYDVGIFNGCRPHVTAEHIDIIGYFRQAGWYQDVTRASGMPEYSDPNGVPFNRGQVTNGADGTRLSKCYIAGSRWALRILGALPPAGATPTDIGSFYAANYYDAVSDALISGDGRGSFGNSDWLAHGCTFYGPDHHSGRRLTDITGTWQTDPGGGAIEIDGLAGNSSGRIQNLMFDTCRISSREMFRIKLGWVNRLKFLNCHNEGGTTWQDTAGNPITTSSYPAVTYGQITADARATRISMIQGNARWSQWNFAPGENGQRFNEFGHDSFAPTYTFDFASTLRTSVVSAMLGGGVSGDELILQSASATPADNCVLRIRAGLTTIYRFDLGVFRPQAAGTVNLGSATFRWGTIFLANSPDVSSDARGKDWLGDLDAAERGVAIGLSKLGGVYTKKGGDGRKHVGITAQQVIAVFEAHGLNWRDYAVVSEAEDGSLSVSYDDLQGWQVAGFGARFEGAE